MDHAWWIAGWVAGGVVVLLVAVLLVVIVLLVRRIRARAAEVTGHLVAVRDNVASLHDLSRCNYELVRIAEVLEAGDGDATGRAR